MKQQGTYAAILAGCLLGFAVCVHADSTSIQCLGAAPCRLSCAATCPSTHFSLGRYGSRRAKASAAAENAQPSYTTVLKPDSNMRMDNLIERVVAVAEQQATAAIQTISPDRYPVATNTATGSWVTVQAGHW